MDFLQIVILSVVQGITEFLPISSSAHLVLVPLLTEWPDQGLLFDLGVHLGTLGAVMIYFRKEVINLIHGLYLFLTGRFADPKARLFMMLSISTIPLLLVAPFIKSWVETVARSMEVIAFTSIFYGLCLYWADKRGFNMQEKTGEVRRRDAFFYGLMQILSLVPGTSRSGICMTAGRLLGYSRVESSRYAMLMAIPVILILGFYGFYDYFAHEQTQLGTTRQLLLGVGLSFISAFACVHLLMKFVEKMGFLPFVLYRVFLGLGLFYITYSA